MSSAFVELLRKSNLDFVVTQKTLKAGSRTDDIIFASFVDAKSKALQLAACLDQSDSVTVWSTSLDERTFQLNARLLDSAGLAETMVFLSERLRASDFTVVQAVSTRPGSQNELPQLNVTFTHPKNKQSVTLHLDARVDDGEKASMLSKILVHVYKRNEQLTSEVNAQQLQMKELASKAHQGQSRSNRAFDDNKLFNSANDRNNAVKSKERTQMSLINPSAKRRKAATGVTYDDDESD